MLEDKITVGDRTLYGMSNGQLELVSIRFETRYVIDRYQKFAIITFTDHDVQALPDDVLKNHNINPYYELEFPVV